MRLRKAFDQRPVAQEDVDPGRQASPFVARRTVALACRSEVVALACRFGLAALACRSEVVALACRFVLAALACRLEVAALACRLEVATLVCRLEVTARACRLGVTSLAYHSEATTTRAQLQQKETENEAVRLASACQSQDLLSCLGHYLSVKVIRRGLYCPRLAPSEVAPLLAHRDGRQSLRGLGTELGVA